MSVKSESRNRLDAVRLELRRHCDSGADCAPEKLDALMFRVDFEHYAAHERSLSGAVYVRGERGPIPVASTASDARVTIDLSSGEAAAIRRIARESRDTSVEQAQAWCRAHPGWRLAAAGEEIPYAAAFLNTDPPSPAETEHASALVRTGRCA